MSRYDSLSKHLANLNRHSWVASFSEIESILGRKLPNSARLYEPWWSNSRQEGRHNAAWLDVGWITTDLSLDRKVVTFRKSDILEKKPRAIYSKAIVPKPRKVSERSLACSWDIANKEQLGLAWVWKPLGLVTLDAGEKLLFPTSPARAGIYRIRIRWPGREARYIGEADNLARRFGNYRRPGPTQQTSLRIGNTLQTALRDKAEVAVACIVEASLNGRSGKAQVDFSSKVVRCLFENAVLFAEHGEDIENLNRAMR